MEDISTENFNYNLDFKGKGSEFFGIIIINWLLTIVTLGFYYPWAKVRRLKYVYNATTFNDDSFEFHGTGKEMFIGFIKTILIVVLIYGLMYLFTYLQMPLLGVLSLYLGFFILIPIAIHGSYSYRMSRSSWRGIRFGYRGDRKELFLNFLKWIFFTIITFGIYSSWLSMNLRRYIIGNIKFGDLSFRYDGEGGEYFGINIKGYILTLLTLGIYSFWWQRDLFEYYVNNIKVLKDDKVINANSTAEGSGFLGLQLGNLLIIVFTLGLGYAWVMTRTLDFVIRNIELDGNIDINTIIQTEKEYNNALGEDISDFLNLDVVV